MPTSILHNRSTSCPQAARILVPALLLLSLAAPVRGEPMECTPEIIRMALSGGGTMPAELLRACQAIPTGDEMYGLAQYMMAVHYERRRDLRSAAMALGRAASRPPFATDPRVLYRLSRDLIAAGDLEGALIAKDRLLLNSGAMRSEDRRTALVTLNRLLNHAYEAQAALAQEEGDDDRYRQAMVAAMFYKAAALHLSGRARQGHDEEVGLKQYLEPGVEALQAM